MPTHERRAARWALALGAVACATLALAALTRPVDRASLPTTLDPLRPSLAALHQGPAPCARWGEPPTFGAREQDLFLAEWSALAAPDLQLMLPWMARVRLRSHEAERAAHAQAPADEARAALLARLSWFDRARLTTSGGQRLDQLLPALQRFEQAEARRTRDEARAARLAQRLTPEQGRALDALAARWAPTLAHPDAQQDLLQRVAREVTRARMDALQRGLARYRGHYGRPPNDFAALLAWERNTGTLDPMVERGLAPDGSLVDGWLRPFTYYTLREGTWVLLSEGPSEQTEEDDLALRP
jgi:hypothetical protein